MHTTTKIMGILNTTPDSFSDGGHYLSPSEAIVQAFKLKDQGADILDIGAESSRPGAAPISAEEEWKRLEPVLKGLRAENFDLPISIDTYKPETIERSLDYGVAYINNIKGLTTDTVLEQVSKSRSTGYIAMHMHLTPKAMQEDPIGGDAIVETVAAFFKKVKEKLTKLNFDNSRIYYDPGFGFGKTDAANIKLLSWLKEVQGNFGQVVIGVSRKSFFQRVFEVEGPAENRDPATKALELGFLFNNISIVRTHDVKGLALLRSFLNGDVS